MLTPWPRASGVRSLGFEWLCLAVLLGALVASVGAGQWLQRLDRVAYDAAMAVWQRPASPAILIVAIDQESLDAVGRWPWSRALHAALIDRLAQAKPAAILLDLILTEPADAASDAALASALARAGNVALPVYAQMQPGGGARLLRPHLALAQAAAALGHIHLELDGDSVARRVYLDEIGAHTRLQHLAAAALSVARQTRAGRQPDGLASADSQAHTESTVDTGAAAPAPPDFEPRLRHQRPLAIAYAGAPGHFERVSYAAVLRGEVAPERLAGRVLLVGATAPGLGDAYPTPLSGHGVAMPGVEIMANIIDTLEQGIDVRELGSTAQALVATAITWLMLAALLVLAPRAALWATLAAALAVVLAAVLCLRWAGLWWSPAAALLGILLAYPLWSWRRLEAAARYLDNELSQHARDAGLGQALMPAAALALATHPGDALAPQATSSQATSSGHTAPATHPARDARGPWRDAFARRLGQAHSAAAALRLSREVFGQSLAGLPLAVLVCDARHQVFLANDAASQLLGATGAPLPQQLANLQAAGQAAGVGAEPDAPDAPSAAVAVAVGRWRDALNRTLREGGATTHPLADGRGRSWLVSLAPYARLGGTPVGAIVTLMDVTELQRLQREEREFLQYLSHDLRAPSHAVLALVDLASSSAPDAPMPGLLERIARQAERSLALLDALLMQQRADRIAPQDFRHHDLAQMLHEVADQLWPRLQACGQQLVLLGVAEPAWVRGRGELLLRALANLAINASNYSGPGSRIELTLQRQGTHWLCAVSDNGPGIAAQHLPRLFERHFRAPRAPGDDAVDGSGLGLAFVKTVALRHGGQIDVISVLGKGAMFTLQLPACDDDDAHDSDGRDHPLPTNPLAHRP